MNFEGQEQIRRTLQKLAAAHAATIELMERALALFTDEAALKPDVFWKSRSQPKQGSSSAPTIDESLLSIVFRGKSCFLGNTVLFRFFACLNSRPNAFHSYEDLFENVWHGTRTEYAVRRVVKRLREMLRLAGMAELADAIDGSQPGHYALRLPNPTRKMPHK